MPSQTPIILVALNARYSHAAFAAMTLRANLGPWRAQCAIIENDTDVTPFQLAGWLAERAPRVIGFSTYLWNVVLVRQTAQILRQVLPEATIVVGGPEITAGTHISWAKLADVVVTGEGEEAFRRICAHVLQGGSFRHELGLPTLLDGGLVKLADLHLPYADYNDHDLAHRTIYVESSRGCPFGCTYCTSRRQQLRLFDTTPLFAAFDNLLERGVRAFRFLDRSFNANEKHACAVLEYFLAKKLDGLNIHLEIMPADFTTPLRRALAAFPPGALHLEVGIQTLNPKVGANIDRAANPAVVLRAIDFLMNQARATLHADLIFGLPGEDEASFAAGFDRLVKTFDPPELQVNLLKGLPGTPLADRKARHGLVFNPNPPYELLYSGLLSFADITRMQNFARCWELVHNRGRFGQAARAIWEKGQGSPYRRYMALAQQIHHAEGRMHAIGANRLQSHIDDFLASL